MKKIVFLGNGQYGCATFAWLLDHIMSKDVSLTWIITTHDKWTKQIFAKNYNIKFQLYVSKSKTITDKIISKEKPDLILCASFGQILKKTTLLTVNNNCFNFHPSLLPKLRGPSPIRSLLLLGESQTGLTIYRMNEKLDAGDICWQKEIIVEPDDHYLDLYEKIQLLTKNAIHDFYELYTTNKLVYYNQKEADATYCKKIKDTDGYLNFHQTSENNLKLIRALSFNPGTPVLFENKKRYLIKRARKLNVTEMNYSLVKKKLLIGQLFLTKKQIIVKTKDSLLEILELQAEGKKAMQAREFVNGWKGQQIISTISLKRNEV